MLEWKAVDPPVDIRNDWRAAREFLVRGNLLKLSDDPGERIVLVGDVNTSGGVCDDCGETGMIIAVCTDLTKRLP